MLVLSLLGINPLPFMEGLQQAQQQSPQMEPTGQPYQEGEEEARLREMTEVVLADTEDTWSELLPGYGINYQVPNLVLFNEAVQSYNTRIKRFPTNLFAGMFGFTARPYFEAAPGAETAPRVDFSGVGGEAPATATP